MKISIRYTTRGDILTKRREVEQYLKKELEKEMWKRDTESFYRKGD